MGTIEERLLALEEQFVQRDLQQFRYPIDQHSVSTLRNALDKNITTLLLPLETAATNEGTATLLNNTACIQFADAATKEAYFVLPVIERISITSFQFIWSTPATTGNLRWTLDIGAGGDSEATNARTTGGTAVTTAADGTANDLNFTDIFGVNAGINFVSLESVRSQIWGFKFTRTGAHADDTLTDTVNLYGLLLEYRLYPN